MVKVIRTNAEYEAALAALVDLMDQDPEPGSRGFEKLELLTILIKHYETKKVQFDLPDPIEAIRFRMEQQNLRQRDLVPYLGSRSKVSEVLSGKRALSLAMARALHTGLGIPAAVLLQRSDELPFDDSSLDWNRFPFKEMVTRGWIPEERFAKVSDALREFLGAVGSGSQLAALYRSSALVRSARSMDTYALIAWSARIVRRALAYPPSAAYERGTVNLCFMKELAALSAEDEGPLRAVEFLRDHGVAVIVEPHLSGTYLDGAAVMHRSDHPVVGLTLRHDRLDNFWFTLMHELAHIALHAETAIEEFFDDLDVDPQGDQLEAEADALAGEALLPEEEWRRSPASRLRTPEAAEHLAAKLGINPAIVAGRMRFESQSYSKLSHMVGHGEVRKLFPEVSWS